MAALRGFGAAGRIYSTLVGAIVAVIGLVLAGGGLWLVIVGGSWYYLLAGLGLIASGVFLIRGQALGVAVFVGVWAATWIWAFWEVGLQGWPLVPRVVAPTILLFFVLAALPMLAQGRLARGTALGGLAGLGVFLLAVGIAVAVANRPPEAEPFPQTPFAQAPAAVSSEWIAYGGDAYARRYSPLAQITPENVDDLERVWVAHTGDMPSEAADGKYAAETTPLKIGDRLYLCSAMNVLIAMDAATGREIWRYDPNVQDDWIPYSASCRGVAYYADPEAAPDQACATRIIEGTLDGRLIAVDARTGRPCAGFGRNGQVDIKNGMGPVHPGMVAITSPPAIVRGVVVTGHQVLDGQENSAPSGVVQGFDAITGAQVWAWDLGRPGTTAPAQPGETYTRGTPNMWTIASADEQLGMVYLPMGNSAVDYWSTDRSAQENFYATSLVALNAETGQPAWRFQTVHMDVWDYDLGSQATLVDLPVAGGAVPAIILPSKQGDIFILDRRTGQPLTPVEERPVPQGGVEPAQRTATQPFSAWHTLAFPMLTEKDMWGMSPIDQMFCRIGFRRAEYRGVYTPPTTERHWIQYPGYNGGSDWGSVAVDPVRGIIVANYNNMPNYNRLIPREEADERGWAPVSKSPPGSEAVDVQAGTPYAIDVNAGWRMKATGMLCKEPPYGGIRAIDMRTGETLWDRDFGSARRNGPFGIPSMLPITIGTPNNGGGVVTAGGLIFIAATTDNMIRAIDLATGETLWSDVLPAGGQATPITYAVGGRQYVVLMAGGHHFMETPVGDEVIAWALPAEAD